MANIAPPLKPIACHNSLLSPFFPDDFCHITMNIPNKIIRTEMNLRKVYGKLGDWSKPKLSMTIPIIICPNIGIKAVCIAPSFGKIMILTVSPHRPHIPPSHDHQGSVENNSRSIKTPPFSQRVTIRRKIVPIEKDTKEAIKGDTTACRKREFAAVCMGVSTPKKNMGIRYHIAFQSVDIRNGDGQK